jgi:hypothetical protein
VKQPLFFRLNNSKKAQLLFAIIGVILVIFVFLIIMLGSSSSSFFNFSVTFKNFVSLRSLVISGLRYSLYQINQNPYFSTTSSQFNMPQGNFIYTVTSTNFFTKIIEVRANLNNSSLSKILKATATINEGGVITSLEISEQ